MYCDIHRVFLEMLHEYNDIRMLAEQKLNEFLSTPSKRVRSATPDLGDLVEYLTITDSISWEDIRKAYIQESFRRNARFMRDTAGHVPLQSLQGNFDNLFNFWMQGSNGGRVTMFSIQQIHCN
jgi:hypothetical protein